MCLSGCSRWIIHVVWDAYFLWPVLYCDVPFTWDQANHTCSLHNSTLLEPYPEVEHLLPQLEPKHRTYLLRKSRTIYLFMSEKISTRKSSCVTARGVPPAARPLVWGRGYPCPVGGGCSPARTVGTPSGRTWNRTLDKTSDRTRGPIYFGLSPS